MGTKPRGADRLRSLLRLAAHERSMFVAVSLGVNLVLVGRSYVTMQVLDYRDLGLAGVLQSIVLLLGVMQFGFLNGGYRLLCSAQDAEARRINDLVFSFIGTLALAAVVITLAATPLLRSPDVILVTWLGVVGGIATLTRTWLMNHMIARGELSRVNRVNLVSAAGSVAMLVFIPVAPLTACLAAVVAQPIIFVLGAIVADRSMIPGRFEFSRPLVRDVIRAGFVMFLVGVFLQVNFQFERWYVTGLLGLEAMGHLYLATLFITLFQMVPVSLDQIFLPPIVRSEAAGDEAAVRGALRQFFLVELAYCIAAGAAVGLLAEPTLGAILPQYVGDLRYVYIVLPGLLLITLSAPFSIMFNVLIRYRFYFAAYGAGTLLTGLVLLAGAWAGGALNLDHVMLLRSVVYGLMAVAIVAGFHAITADRPGLRFSIARPQHPVG
ncbi:MAG: hypothetical protein H2038_08450 [Brevundimonas sp.]|uniref:lipopolysaccharide biosynthesis protein n=1 Tax=Brevundimonas sp. TaxID=1871086 RepID=UPI0017A8B7AC|nr:hypothetical protein [Brevundimonas sp.]MBA4804663.1 hypothetical protein [Brevundimonas sp.]